MLAQTHEI
ncbi:hypothetical protein D039_3736A, partial [Vibrio parahaemolyticus EKP-028]